MICIVFTGAATVNAMRLLSDGSDLLQTLKQSKANAIILDPDIPYSPWEVSYNLY